ncbi:hypothetical protein [Metasolibacillus meyeri]|uniref:hypothetical protein n=1 Tax=Metasolibacillus meyeri TaxID=1071052 RepID=UPI000D319905|nr:hypothetical protein [Metasolibacillus meyeri]
MKPYIFKQAFCIITLIIFTYVTHSYIQNKTIQIENNTLKGIILVLAAALLLFICNQLLYNYGQKETKFMQHKLWDKMFIVIFIWLAISFVVFILLFFTTSLQQIFMTHPWMMLIIVYYFLFFINLFVLSIIHLAVDRSSKLERKLLFTWTSSTLLVAVILFMFPTI